MQEAVPVGLGSMVAVLGTKIDIIKELISLNLNKMMFVRLQTITLKDR